MLVCANAEGQRTTPPLFIEKSRCPKCFDGRNGNKYGFYYTSNSTGWMTEVIFTQWPFHFSYIISTITKRPSLLLLENAPNHVHIDRLPNFRFMRVQFFPKHTTSILQPLHAGVIACLKRRYKRKLYQRALNLFGIGVSQNLYTVDLKLLILWLYDLWSGLENSVIRNC